MYKTWNNYDEQIGILQLNAIAPNLKFETQNAALYSKKELSRSNININGSTFSQSNKNNQSQINPNSTIIGGAQAQNNNNGPKKKLNN